ncbi:MAG TPA: MaoC family dehydratase [Bauldia sp.]|nr:MaoC family dehydratase [Bauldia sp.]
MNAYDQIAIGDIHVFGKHTFTAEGIRRFAAKYDPQVFHLDEEAARQSLFGGLCASGWHTAAVMMRLLVDYFDARDAKARAAGQPPLVSGPSPGLDDLRWPNPVRPGDVVEFTARIVGKRLSKSRPGWGLLSMTTTGVKQTGEVVFMVTTHAFVETGQPAPIVAGAPSA